MSSERGGGEGKGRSDEDGEEEKKIERENPD